MHHTTHLSGDTLQSMTVSFGAEMTRNGMGRRFFVEGMIVSGRSGFADEPSPKTFSFDVLSLFFATRFLKQIICNKSKENIFTTCTVDQGSE